MKPEQKYSLSKLMLAAKAIIFDAKRMSQFLPMMDTKSGAIQAVQSVIAVIEQKKPVPADLAPLLGVSVYMLMVDMAKDVTGMKPDPEVVKGVAGEILATIGQAYGGQPPVQQGPAAPQSQGGIIQQKAMA
jgi:hypothetical protein